VVAGLVSQALARRFDGLKALRRGRFVFHEVKRRFAMQNAMYKVMIKNEIINLMSYIRVIVAAPHDPYTVFHALPVSMPVAGAGGWVVLA
jgi:hypothetical protein